MTRQQAVEIARRCAKAKSPIYYAEPFEPHEWVVDAILEAAHTHAEPWVFCNNESCAWAGEQSQLVCADLPTVPAHCPECESTDLLYEEVRRGRP